MAKAKIERSLGFWRTWALSIGTMIGSGIFLLPVVLAPYGGLGLSAWLIAGGGTLLMALTLGNLARRIPRTGGPYTYSRAGFGDLAGFLMAWGYWISTWAACAAITVALVGYLGVFFPVLDANPLLAVGVGWAVLWTVVLINIRGVRQVGIVQLVTTILKLIPLLAIGLFGLFYIEPANLPAMNPTGKPAFEGLAAATMLVMWAFAGMECATIPADNIINPKKTIPRALVTAALGATAIYFLASFSVMGVVPADQLVKSEAPFADAAKLMWGQWAAYAIAIGALISTFGALNSNTLATSQTAMAASLDGLFPEFFGKLSHFGTPRLSLLAAGFLISGLMVLNYTEGFVAAFTFIILLSTLTTIVPLAFAAMAALAIEFREKGAVTGRRLREAIIATLAFAYGLWAIAGAGPEAVYWGFILLMAGLPVYVLITRRKK